MDAPPEKEDCRAFVHVAELFLAAGVHVPRIFAQDFERGFLLLSDLGTRTYLDELRSERADELYLPALEALIRIQLASKPNVLPVYDREKLLLEMQLFPDWYVARYKSKTLSTAQRQALDRAFEALLANNLDQPSVFVHRDYHSRNLMVCDPNPGVLDFQDALYGPITYDMASLLKDAYIEWSEERILDWLARYWERARKAGLPVNPDFAQFHMDFEWMGLQRHLKVLGIFARLYFRDGKDGYLKDLPLVMKYTRAVCARYLEFHPLLKLLEELECAPSTVVHAFSRSN
jgi:N-acetylmuramate 1-kinase